MGSREKTPLMQKTAAGRARPARKPREPNTCFGILKIITFVTMFVLALAVQTLIDTFLIANDFNTTLGHSIYAACLVVLLVIVLLITSACAPNWIKSLV